MSPAPLRDMGFPFLRRRAKLGNPGAADSEKNELSRSPRTNCHFNTILFLAVFGIWGASLLFSGAVFHVCFTSRKLNVYCIHANFTRDADTVKSSFFTFPVLSKDDQRRLPPFSNATSTTRTNTSDKSANATTPSTTTSTAINAAPPTITNASIDANSTLDRELEVKAAVEEVKRKVKVLRSLAGPINATHQGCEGRGVYVYELPLKFNLDIMRLHCHELLPWQDLCDYFTNDAMGKPLPSLGKRWYSTHQYSLEPIFHQRVLRHPCRVRDPKEAKLFYVPFYAGLDVLRLNFQNASKEAKDELGQELIRWLEGQASWKRNQGRDHMFVLGKVAWDFRRVNNVTSWGTSFLRLKEMNNPVKLLIERQPWEIRDIGIPHPTHFHPHSDKDIVAWQRRVLSYPRKQTVGFAGAPRNNEYANVRSVLIEQCTSAAAEVCKFRDCRSGNCDRAEELMELFLSSEFCLQPIGDSPTRKSVFDGLVAGCIPVFFDPFTAYYQYPWHLPEDHARYSVLFDKLEVKAGKVNVVEKLRGISAKEREDMRRFIVYEIMPGLVYGDATSHFHNFTDAFGIAMRGVMHGLMAST